MDPKGLLPFEADENQRGVLTKKQISALTDFLKSRQAGHCFFRPEDFSSKRGDGGVSVHVGKGNANFYGASCEMSKSCFVKHDVLEELLSEDDHEEAAHGHHPHRSFVTAIAAGIIDYIIVFGFCCAYGVIMFMDKGHKQHRGLGMKMTLATAMIMGFILATTSTIPIAVGGPDMNPVIFVSAFVEKISKELRSQLDLVPGDDGPDGDFCYGDHYYLRKADCDDYHEQLRATSIFAVSTSSFTMALVFMFLGGCKLTKYVAYVPTSIVDAFLSCMGYKVFKFGLKLCKYDPRIFCPAAAVGVPLYFFKALHIGKPMYVIPTFLIMPVGVFYVLLYATGSDVESARKDNLMFEYVYAEDFWNLWADGFLNTSKINRKAWTKTLLDLGIMVVVCVLDTLVTALRMSEAKLPMKIPHKNYEMSLYGAGNVASALASSSTGYMQLKLNVVNYGVLHNVEDRRGGMLYSVLIASAFFGPIGHVNYMPRIFLGQLLFFGGSAFVAEHLWGSKEYLSFIEWVQVCLILGVFIFTGEIMYAMLLGAMMCGVTFIVKYAKIPCIAGRPMRGGELQSREQHSALLSMGLSHIASSWLLVMRLKGFVFFASVQTVTSHVRTVLAQEEENNIPMYRRIKFVLLDCELLDGLDSSAEKDIQQLRKDLMAKNRKLLWSNILPGHAKSMIGRGTMEEEEWFNDLDDALLYVEGMALHFRKHQAKIWERLHPSFALHQQLMALRESYEPFIEVLRLDIERFGCPWSYIGRCKIRTCKTILWSPNEVNRELFLVHTGAVGIFHEIPSSTGDGGNNERPMAIYRHGWFLNREFLMQAPTRQYAVALEDGEVVYWTQAEWWRMHREQPLMASAIIEAAMRQASSDMERAAKSLRSSTSATVDEDAAAAILVQSLCSHEAGVRDKDDLQLPDYLQSRLEFMACAQALETHHLYDPVPNGETGILPELPVLIRRDLEIAFHTYSVNDVIPWEKVNEALMYAGLFNTLLVHSQKVDVLTEQQFIEVGHEAAFLRLSNKQIMKIRNVFRRYSDRDGLLNRDRLIDVLNSTFIPQITEQEVNGISTVFDVDGSGSICAKEFIGIVSRFVRRHEQDWNLLRGLRHLLQKGPKAKCKETDVLTAPKLMKSAEEFGVKELSLDEAEEMLWCAACYCKLISASQQGKMVDFSGVAAAVILSVDIPWGKLPPEPVYSKDEKNMKRKSAARKSMAGARSMQMKTHMNGAQSFGVQKPAQAASSEDVQLNQGKALKKDSPPAPKKVFKKSRTTVQRDEFFQSRAKRLFLAAREKLIAKAAAVACEEVGLQPSRYDISTDLVMDLRTTCSSEAGPQMFHKARLSVHDFKREEEEELRRGHGIQAQSNNWWNKKTIPDTPDAKIHQLLEDPDSSPAAKLWSKFMAVCIFASVFVLVLKDLMEPDEEKRSETFKKVFKVLECCFTIFFLSELVVRFAVSDALGTQTKLEFIRTPLNICDFFSVCPFFIELAIDGNGYSRHVVLRISRLLRLARVIRIARLAKGKSVIFGPASAVFTIVWGIYLKEKV